MREGEGKRKGGGGALRISHNNKGGRVRELCAVKGRGQRYVEKKGERRLADSKKSGERKKRDTCRSWGKKGASPPPKKGTDSSGIGSGKRRGGGKVISQTGAKKGGGGWALLRSF